MRIGYMPCFCMFIEKISKSINNSPERKKEVMTHQIRYIHYKTGIEPHLFCDVVLSLFILVIYIIQFFLAVKQYQSPNVVVSIISKPFAVIASRTLSAAVLIIPDEMNRPPFLMCCPISPDRGIITSARILETAIS